MGTALYGVSARLYGMVPARDRVALVLYGAGVWLSPVEDAIIRAVNGIIRGADGGNLDAKERPEKRQRTGAVQDAIVWPDAVGEPGDPLGLAVSSRGYSPFGSLPAL